MGFFAQRGKTRFTRLETLLSGLDIIPSSRDLERRWGAVRFERRKQPIGVADAWIAASALVLCHSLIVG
jgi:predicted nucleic acid-binding protein